NFTRTFKVNCQAERLTGPYLLNDAPDAIQDGSVLQNHLPAAADSRPIGNLISHPGVRGVHISNQMVYAGLHIPEVVNASVLQVKNPISVTGDLVQIVADKNERRALLPEFAQSVVAF